MDRERYADHIDGFADWCVGTSPRYEYLARGVADDPDLLDLAAETPGSASRINGGFMLDSTVPCYRMSQFILFAYWGIGR